jgi:DNA-binding MurR/RpiR family transcriptional regulator
MTPIRTAGYIRGLVPSLAPTEARVATALLADIPGAVAWSVAELASVSSTSPATVVRACQRFGFSGWGQLRAELVRELSASGDALSSGPGEPSTVLERTLRGAASQIESARAMLDPGAFERAVEALVAARRTVVATSSDLAMLGQYATFRFASVGRAVEAPLDAITQRLVAGTLGPGDVLLAVGHSGTNELTLGSARAAADAGATVIAVTAFAQGPLADAAAIHLCVGVADPETQLLEASRVRVTQLVAIDALQTAVGLRVEHEAAADTTHRAQREFEHRRVPRSAS